MPSTATRSRPLHPRRVSGPVRRPLPAGAPVRGRTSAFERIARIPDNRIVDRVLRSRGVIWLIGIMLGGIVAMQVSLLRLNTGINNAVLTQKTLADQNATLQGEITKLTSAADLRAKAAGMNMVDPAAGDTRFLTSRGEKDAVRAARRMAPPSDAARMVLLNDGFAPGPGATIASLLAAKQNASTTAVVHEQAPTPPAGVAPATTPEPLPTPAATPTVDPAAGLATAG